MSDRAFMAYDIQNQIADADGISAGKILEKEVSLTSAEILLLYTTPKTLVAAPGSGKVLEFVSAVFFLDHGGTDYAAGGALVVQTITGNTAVSDAVAAATLINAVADVYVVAQALSAEVALDVNQGLELSNADAVHTTGNGTLNVRISYRVHDFN